MQIATGCGRVQTDTFRGFRREHTTAAGFKRGAAALELRLRRDEGPAQ
jgi:hypothetical protein